MLRPLLEQSTPLDIARAFLLVVIGLSWSIVISVGGFLIVQTYGEEVSKGPPFADQAMAVAEVLERTPASRRPEVLRAVTSNYFDVALQPDATEPSADNFQASMLTFRFLTQNTFSQNTRRGPGAMEVLSILAGLQRPGPEIDGLEVLLSDGTLVAFVLRKPFKRRDDLLRQLFYLFVIGSTIITLSMILVYRLGNPLGTFKEATLRLADDIEAPPLDEKRGVAEVRAVSKTLNAMQQRVKDYLAERTTMLAAISHDIRTGLFRLRMRSEKLEDPTERAKALEDADEMAAILDDMLTFARSDQNDIGFEKLSLPSLLTSICDNLEDQGKDAAFESGGRMTIIGDRTSLKRGFLNLIENGTKYGLRSRVSTERTEDGAAARVIIDDDGPGIAPEQRDAVFQPFVRLEDSRNRKTGGTGLGLAIVKKVMDRHGARMTLTDSPSGGLRVIVELDLA